jgi:serine phosphatase RsbU (regulator of sigma subunit)
MDAPIPSRRSELPSARWVRVAAALVLTIAALDWVGWATGIQELTRINPSWPSMKPWTALWLAALAVAILVQSGSPSPSRVWFGRGLAAAVTVTTLAVLVEYATGRTFGIDQVWFGQSVRAAQATLPGRTSPQTVSAALLLSVAIGLARVNRRWTPTACAMCLAAAMVTPFVTILAYLFGAVRGLQVGHSTGMALTTAISLLLLGLALVALRPAWLHAHSDRLSLMRLGMIVAGFPLLIGLSRWAFLGLDLQDDLSLTFSVAVGTLLLGTVAYRVSRREYQLSETIQADRALLRASLDGMLDPQVLLEAVRDPSGAITEFVYIEVNEATCEYLGLSREDLLGRGLTEMNPGVKSSEVFGGCVKCLDTGEPLAIDDMTYDNEILLGTRRYDLRATRATPTCITLSWRDVTERFAMTLRISDARHRLQKQTDQLISELRSAADYVTSVLPGDLAGPVQVSSRYLPSQQLAGDCFDYRWVDDDHLVVYLLDVSGHGVGPALLSMSVHNMLRSDALPFPDLVLSELNRRFQMEQQGGHYFTIWFGVYEQSTRTLRYACAGAPPAFAVSPSSGITALSSSGHPIGMFEDSVFTVETYAVPHGCRILLFSDGAYEFDLGSGQQLSLDDFTRKFARLAESSDWSLDDLVDELRALTQAGQFEDDCTLVQMSFD